MEICVLGRQPELGLAELESLYGADAVRPLGTECALVSEPVAFSRLGSSVKCAELLTTVPSTDLHQVFKQVARLLPKIIMGLPEGKLKIGISAHGFTVTPYTLNGEGLKLKKALRKLGRSVRLVPNESSALSSAQTFHNKLTSELGFEFLVVQSGNETYVGRVTNVQDIDSYRVRDRERPKRDAFVGMLPPKLAQTIINLATGKSDDGNERIEILDPFCGTGVILQEALLMGYDVYGTDLSQKMIDYTRTNLEWLQKEGDVTLEAADATKHDWHLSELQTQISQLFIASETYLGQPLGGQHPSAEKLAEIVHDTNRIVEGFLKNIAPQLASGTRLCLAVPAWFVDDTLTELPVVSELASLGFLRHTFRHAVTPLIYHREDQVTGRELLVLEKE